LVDSKGSPPKIPRFLDKDKEGILQIGSSGNVRERLKRFRGAADGKEYPHSAGKRLALVKKLNPFKKTYEEFKIEYHFRRLEHERRAKEEEDKLLKCYFRKFGEAPPLNNSLPGRDLK